MGNFFKSLAKGLLYFLAFPGIIIAASVYAVFGVFVFLYQFGKLIYLFFTGRTLFTDLEEDQQVKAIIEANKIDVNQAEEVKEVVDPFLSPIYGSDYVSPVAESKEENNEEPTQEVTDVIEGDKDDE